LKTLLTLKSKYCHGYDEISIKILKPSIPYISSPLTYLCNCLLFRYISF